MILRKNRVPKTALKRLFMQAEFYFLREMQTGLCHGCGRHRQFKEGGKRERSVLQQ